MPPQAHVLAFVFVGPEPTDGKVLDFIDAGEQVLIQPVIPHGAVVAFDIGMLLGLAGLEVGDRDALGLGPVGHELAEVFGAMVAADRPGFASPGHELIERPDHPF